MLLNVCEIRLQGLLLQSKIYWNWNLKIKALGKTINFFYELNKYV